MRILTVLLLCLLLPEIATAVAFSPPPTDKSVSLLGIIFGTHVGPVYLGGPANPALRHMFEIFNSVVISLGTIIISYVGIVSTINTAQQGKPMGQKWNSIWIPMRAVSGMVLIIPTPGSGYSVIQTTIMWLILQGIGAADLIWNNILLNLESGMNVVTGVQRQNRARPEAPIPEVYLTLDEIGKDLSREVLRSAVCLNVIQNIASGKAKNDFGFSAPPETVAARYGSKVKFYVTPAATPAKNNDFASVTGTAYVGVEGDPRFFNVCGTYRITATVERNEWDVAEREAITANQLERAAANVYQIKKNALIKMFSNLNPLAEAIASQNKGLRPTHPQTGRLMAPYPGNFVEPAGYMQLAANTFALEMQHAIRPHKIAALQQVVRNGMLNGWISAGSFFFVLNQTQDVDFFDTVTAEPITENIPACNNPAQCSAIFPNGSNILGERVNSFLEDYAERAYMASRLWDAYIYLTHDEISVVDRFDVEPLETPTDLLQHQTSELLRDMMNEHNDPLIAQGKFGSELMRVAEQTWSKRLADHEVFLDRLAAEERPLTAEERHQIETFNSNNALILGILAILWGIGAMLAIYIPLIPYLIFTVAVVGWFLLVIEAIVAAPVLAISFMLPSGEELGKIAQGLMLLLNIVLRPTLMLFGFILAIRLYQAVVQLVNFSIIGNLDNIDVGNSSYAWMAIITIYGAFTVSLANKCFSLIYALPDKILRWMGGGPEHTDVSQEIHSVKGGLGKGEEMAKQISSGFVKREMVRLDARAKNLMGDEVTGGAKKHNPDE
jgi:conjugal transfer/type IV secretion protein DotA/TraY